MDKKELILRVSADLFHKYGYNSVGLSSILNESKVPKGSFYHYFNSKEDLLVAVIEHFITETEKLFNSFPKSIEGLYHFFNTYFNFFESLNYTRGCPIGNFALELADVNENARLCLNKWTRFLEREIEAILIQESYEFNEAKKLSSFIVSAFEGVLLKAKIEKNKKPLDEFNYFIFTKLLNFKEDYYGN